MQLTERSVDEWYDSVVRSAIEAPLSCELRTFDEPNIERTRKRYQRVLDELNGLKRFFYKMMELERIPKYASLEEITGEILRRKIIAEKKY